MVYRRGGSSAALIACMLGAGACGPSATDQAKTYILNEGRLGDILSIWGQTLAVSGRHAVIPAGLDLGGSGPACMGGDTDGTVSVMIAACEQDGDVVACALPESYDCNYVQGTLSGSVISRADGMTVALDSTNYTEGNLNLLGIELLYEGTITIHTTAQGSRVDQGIRLTVTTSDGPTVYDNSAYWDIGVTDDGVAMFDGEFTLPTELGDLRVTATDLAFQPSANCAGPVDGRIDMRFGNSEHARIEVVNCGTAQLQYINTNDDGVIEDAYDLSPDLLRDAFSLSAADIANFAQASASLSQYPLLYDAEAAQPQIWCRILESSDAVPLFASALTLGARANPEPGTGVAECLLTWNIGGPRFLAGLLAFTDGLSGSAKSVRILAGAAGVITAAVEGQFELSPQQYADAAYVDDLDHLTAAAMWAFTATCPASIDGCEHLVGSPWTGFPGSTTTITADYGMNHFGSSIAVGENSATYFAVSLPD